MGLVSAGDEYNRNSDAPFSSMDPVLKIIDDLFLSNKTLPAHVCDVLDILEACRRARITLSIDKFVFASSSVCFAGYISAAGVQADPVKIKATVNVPVPTTLTDLSLIRI